jgi:hypothetical protein
VLRLGSHAKYGFGELRVRPVGVRRVPEYEEIESTVECAEAAGMEGEE